MRLNIVFEQQDKLKSINNSKNLHMNHNGTNRFTPFFSKNNYLIYFWDFSSKIPQSPPNVRKIRYLLLKIRNFLQKNERNRFTTAAPVRNGEPVRAVVVLMFCVRKLSLGLNSSDKSTVVIYFLILPRNHH